MSAMLTQRLEQLYERVNARDVDGVFAMIADDGEFYDCSGYTVSGKAAMRASFEGSLEGMPDYRIERIINVAEAPNLVIAEVELSGTHLGTYFGFPATGKELRWTCSAVYEFNSDGLLQREAYYYDTAGLGTQLSSAD
jgi:steroid delta-isomerase-like uncharacterized protein